MALYFFDSSPLVKRMADEQAISRVHFDTVQARSAAGELDGDTRLGDRAVSVSRTL